VSQGRRGCHFGSPVPAVEAIRARSTCLHMRGRRREGRLCYGRERTKPHRAYYMFIARARAPMSHKPIIPRLRPYHIRTATQATGMDPSPPASSEPRMRSQSSTQPQLDRATAHMEDVRLRASASQQNDKPFAARDRILPLTAPAIHVEQTLGQARPLAAGGHRFRRARPVTETAARRRIFRIAHSEVSLAKQSGLAA